MSQNLQQNLDPFVRQKLEILKKRIAAGKVDPNEVAPTINAISGDIVAKAIEKGEVAPESAVKAQKAVRSSFNKEQSKLEQDAFHTSTAESSKPNSSYGAVAKDIAIGTAIGTGINRLIGGRQAGSLLDPASYVKTFKSFYYPMPALGFGALSGVLGTIVRPFSDPLYRRGERGYLGSVGASLSADAEGLRRGLAEARERYGLLALPVQGFQVVTNPVAAGARIVQAIKNGLFGSSGVKQANIAEGVIKWEIRRRKK